jgi:4'-phosphopantetheinyl transferase
MVDLAALASSAKKSRAVVSSGRKTKPEEGVVHLWQVAAPLQLPTTAQIETLSDEEIAKGDNFRLGEHRVRYLWRRVILRDILAGYGETSPAQSEYLLGEHGKPSLAGSSLSFNCAHSDALISIAIASDMQVGVDIERVSLDHDWKSIADIAFSPDEIAWVARARISQEAFTQIWTRREALFKAWGKGLHDSMRVTSLVHDGDVISSIVDRDGFNWWVHELAAPAGYEAALATSAPVSRVEIMAYPTGRAI